MTKLQRLFSEQGQSPWLTGLDRSVLRSGQLSEMVAAGIRGVAASPACFADALSRSTAYDTQVASLLGRGLGAEDIYWELLVQDVTEALAALRPLHRSGGGDGLVSVGITPALAQDKEGAVATARSLFHQVGEPNLSIEIPATESGAIALRRLTSEGRNVTVTAIFSLRRYQQVVEAYLSGLETCPGDLSGVQSVASFSLEPLDTEVGRCLIANRSQQVPRLAGRAAVAQAKLAYRTFCDRFSGPRWEALAARGANPQRLAWASAPGSDIAHTGTSYVDSLIGDTTVTIMDKATAAAFEHRGTVARTVDQGTEESAEVLVRLQDAGIDVGYVECRLENEHIAASTRSYEAAVAAVGAKAVQLSHPPAPGWSVR